MTMPLPSRYRLEPLAFEVTDFTDVQNAIRRKHGPRYHLSPDRRAEIAALWGMRPDDASINDAGVFLGAEEIALKAGRCRCEIKLAQSPSGLWAMDTSHATPDSGAGSAPGIWNRIAFDCRDDARAAGLHRMISTFEVIASLGRAGAADARALVALLKAERTPPL